LRAWGEGASECDALLLSPGEFVRVALAGLAESHHFEQFVDAPVAGKHEHMSLTAERAGVLTRLGYADARRFGFMGLIPTEGVEGHAWFAGLGPEPLGNAFSGAHLAEAFAGKAQNIKVSLLDQSIVAGLGNIYVCEALYRARISPLTAAGEISRPRLERLAAEVRNVLGDAIAAGGNYGEIFERNLGQQSALNLARGLNAQWSARPSGLMPTRLDGTPSFSSRRIRSAPGKSPRSRLALEIIHAREAATGVFERTSDDDDHIHVCIHCKGKQDKVSYLKPKKTDTTKLVPTAAWTKSRNMSMGVVNNERAEFILKRLAADALELVAQVGSLLWVTVQIINHAQPIGQFLYVQQIVQRWCDPDRRVEAVVRGTAKG
jgi:formamidopyrimidine-DNA glycosylase